MSFKKINSCINHELALLIQWLRANKISLNATKTEIVIFRPKHKSIAKHMNFRIRAHVSSKVRYLGVILQENLEWEQHLNTLTPKLNGAFGLLAKIRHYVPKSLLKTIYFSVFNSHLIYACQIWGQREDLINKISAVQDKAIGTINFRPKNYPTGNL